MPRKITTVVELRLRTNEADAWRQADAVIADIAAVPGVADVIVKNRSDHYMDLDLSVHLAARSKAELRKLYTKVSRVADKSVLRLASRGCTLNEMF
jgi:hypothetical protein